MVIEHSELQLRYDPLYGVMHEQERIHPVGFVLDFDRTLGDVDAALTRFYNAASVLGIDIEAIKEARKLKENDGGSFNPLEHIPTVLIPQLEEQFVAGDGPSILYSDVKPFLANLQDQGIPHHVVTYGDSKWQELKLRASGYRGEATVIKDKDKGAHISATYSEGVYKVGFKAKSTILIDDKADAFKSLPQDCKGYFIQRSGTKLKSQEGELPPHVTTIRSLSEIVL